jgi:ABC-type glycerol-3-phosphate transport system substrate-binding protein
MKGNFQIVVMVIFIAAAILGVFVFSGAIPIGKNNTPGVKGTVVLWGTEDAAALAPILETFNNINTSFVVKYVQKSSDTFDQDLLESLASGTGPDMIFLPDDLALHYANKITTIPYQSYPLVTFKNNFVDAGGVFLNPSGLLAFPMTIDPLVMYYNRTILDTDGVVYPPATWDDLLNIIPDITKKDNSGQITKSAVALGQFSNVVHAKDILAALFMQTGNPIVIVKNVAPVSTLNDGMQGFSTDLAPILSFYVSFADPLKSMYSWNTSFPSSDEAFSSEDLAFYFGYASELKSLINRNPNENLLVAPFPQIKNANFKVTEAHVTGLAVLSSSRDITTAMTAAGLMASGDFAAKFADALGVAPARRDLLAQKPADAYYPVFYDSALYARSWLDPSPTGTDNIFQKMIEGVMSNSATPSGAIGNASSELDLLLNH